jgi:hypothetical protein
MAMVDFASFSAATRPAPKVVERPLHSSPHALGRSVPLAMH